ncbi:hypothetical protein T11_3363 [Trichinella zimbabwensis]|uniref:Uncharacterized protein n=1 Tax=Trichinella zimbabwensis TaxID=268475 RepID=A0A0V1I0L6_9BILA|nr:hypothetical protein T11_3363 [Trichinella zimbabwensis]
MQMVNFAWFSNKNYAMKQQVHNIGEELKAIHFEHPSLNDLLLKYYSNTEKRIGKFNPFSPK